MPLSYEDGYLLDPLQQGFLLAIRYIFFSLSIFNLTILREISFSFLLIYEISFRFWRTNDQKKGKYEEKYRKEWWKWRDILTERAEFLAAKIHERVKDSDLRSILRCLMNERRVEGEQVKRWNLPSFLHSFLVDIFILIQGSTLSIHPAVYWPNLWQHTHVVKPRSDAIDIYAGRWCVDRVKRIKSLLLRNSPPSPPPPR